MINKLHYSAISGAASMNELSWYKCLVWITFLLSTLSY